METRTFNLFVRRFRDVGYAAQVLGAPHLAVFGASMNEVSLDLTAVCRKLLDRGELRDVSAARPFVLRRVDVPIRALQRGRLLTVPMRFSALVQSEEQGSVTVLVPRLGLSYRLANVADFDGFLEEIIRHELHLVKLERLLEVAYEGEESVRTLAVSTSFSERVAARKAKAAVSADEVKRRRPLPSGLSEACRRLSDERESGAVERAYQRDAEVERLGQALLGTGANVLLVGPPLVGKTALVHELAHRGAGAAGGALLHGLEIYATSGARIVAGMRY